MEKGFKRELESEKTVEFASQKKLEEFLDADFADLRLKRNGRVVEGMEKVTF